MKTPYKVAVLIGSLRKQSFNRAVVLEIAKLAPETLVFEIVEIGGLAFYNEDDEPAPPEAWVSFRQTIKTADALLFAAPEYNRSVSAVLKNALDVGSRPYAQSVWQGKPGAVLSVSVGALGGFGANHHLRQSLMALDIPTMQHPEVYIGSAHDLFDESHRLVNDGTRALLKAFTLAFAEWVHTLAAPRKTQGG
jgi:chromate reductase, NAD(P)H dehydrogenase (quinone)